MDGLFGFGDNYFIYWSFTVAAFQEQNMVKVNLLISISSHYLDQIPNLVEKLRSYEMSNIRIMDSIGIISGTLDDNLISAISELEGVEKVEKEQSISISPPDSPIQ